MSQVLEAPSGQLVEFEFNGIVLGQIMKMYGDMPTSVCKVPVRWWAADEPLRSVEWEGKIYVVGRGKHNGVDGPQITIKGPEGNVTYWFDAQQFETMRLSLMAVQLA